jgi:alpha-galactosidase
MATRREFLSGAAAAAVGIALSGGILPNADGELVSKTSLKNYDILRSPDGLIVLSGPTATQLREDSEGSWTSRGTIVTTDNVGDTLRISISSNSPVERIHARWLFSVESGSLYLGDTWERAYGDLEWRGLEPDRVMPWYFAASNGAVTHGYGVKTAPAAFCFWQIDPQGISLWMDVRSGGSPLQLGNRELLVCQVVTEVGKQFQSSHTTLHELCKQMCPSPRLPGSPMFGCNDWYYAYGNTSADQTRRDTRTIVSLTSGTNIRPFVSIDGGWQAGGGGDGGDWSSGTDKFPDMPGLAADIVNIGARPGIWIRPLYALQSTPDAMRSSHTRALDPTAPGVQEKVHQDIARLVSWGFQLVKHDFSTYDITGRWGFEMGPSPTADGWQFAEGTSRTTAEVVLDLYRSIRAAAGDSFVNGCNTLTHLTAGIFEICRIGDDTSGHQWARTRKMGINSLAFRACQHQAFYAVDPDCIGITNQVPWSENKQMLDLVSRSGVVTTIALSPDVATPDVIDDIRKSLAQTALCRTTGNAIDWQSAISPTRWQFDSGTHEYDWVGITGTNPFESI